MKELTKKRLKKVFEITLDVVITLVLITSLTIAIITTLRRVENGFSGLGTVSSPSMTASGLNVGDVVRVRKQKEYKKGDIIVFYRAPDCYDSAIDKSKVKDRQIWIHEVIDVGKDDLGRTTYLTKGSSNNSDDGYYVPQDFVLGKAKKLSKSTTAFINFVCSVKGIILLVEVPCGLVLVYLVWDLVMYLTADRKQPQEPPKPENSEKPSNQSEQPKAPKTTKQPKSPKSAKPPKAVKLPKLQEQLESNKPQNPQNKE